MKELMERFRRNYHLVMYPEDVFSLMQLMRRYSNNRVRDLERILSAIDIKITTRFLMNIIKRHFDFTMNPGDYEMLTRLTEKNGGFSEEGITWGYELNEQGIRKISRMLEKSPDEILMKYDMSRFNLVRIKSHLYWYNSRFLTALGKLNRGDQETSLKHNVGAYRCLEKAEKCLEEIASDKSTNADFDIFHINKSKANKARRLSAIENGERSYEWLCQSYEDLKRAVWVMQARGVEELDARAQANLAETLEIISKLAEKISTHNLCKEPRHMLEESISYDLKSAEANSTENFNKSLLAYAHAGRKHNMLYDAFGDEHDRKQAIIIYRTFLKGYESLGLFRRSSSLRGFSFRDNHGKSRYHLSLYVKIKNLVDELRKGKNVSLDEKYQKFARKIGRDRFNSRKSGICPKHSAVENDLGQEPEEILLEKRAVGSYHA